MSPLQSRWVGATCFVPLDGPVHGVVEEDHGGSDVEDLAAESAPAVEDGGVGGAGQGVLSVGAQAVGDDAALLGAACEFAMSSAFLPPRHICVHAFDP